MTLLQSNLKNGILELLKRLNVQKNAVVVLMVGDNVRKDDMDPILKMMLNILKDGTLVVVGDCDFNTVNSDLDALSTISEKDRDRIFTDPIIQLLKLNECVHMVKHPSLSIGCFGHYANYLTRHQSFDFPYGETSLFNDLYDLNAFFISVGSLKKPFPLNYANGIKNRIIKRNVCLYDNEMYSYLDFESDLNELSQRFIELSQCELAQYNIYGARYKLLIDTIKKQKTS